MDFLSFAALFAVMVLFYLVVQKLFKIYLDTPRHVFRIKRSTGAVEEVEVDAPSNTAAVNAVREHLDFENDVYNSLRSSAFFNDSFDAFAKVGPDFTFEAFNKRIGVEAKSRLSRYNVDQIVRLARAQSDLDELFLVLKHARPEDEIMKDLRERIVEIGLQSDGSRIPPKIHLVDFSPETNLEDVISREVQAVRFSES